MLLNDNEIGQSGIVEQMKLPFQIERRLQSLGMTSEARLSVLNRKGQGIMIKKQRGTRLALGYNLTRNIMERKVGGR